MKKYQRILIIAAIIFVLAIVLSPIIINECYKQENGYLTLWGARDMLTYVAAVIPATVTAAVSFIALFQSYKANEISNRLLKIEEINSVPCLQLIETESEFKEYYEDSIHFKLVLKNISNGSIEIRGASDLEIHSLLSNLFHNLHFANVNLKFPIVPPKQTKQLEFSINAHDENTSDKKLKLYPWKEPPENSGFTFYGDVSIIFGHANVPTNYQETLHFSMNVDCSATSDKLKISSQQITRSDYQLEELKNK